MGEEESAISQEVTQNNRGEKLDPQTLKRFDKLFKEQSVEQLADNTEKSLRRRILGQSVGQALKETALVGFVVGTSLALEVAKDKFPLLPDQAAGFLVDKGAALAVHKTGVKGAVDSGGFLMDHGTVNPSLMMAAALDKNCLNTYVETYAIHYKSKALEVAKSVREKLQIPTRSAKHQEAISVALAA